MVKKVAIILMILAVIFSLRTAKAEAAPYDSMIQRWTKQKIFTGEDKVTTLTINATYYSAELIEASIQKETEKNLWTDQEREQYKYKLLNTLHLDEMIPIKIEFINYGDTMYLGPFDIFVKLRIGGKTYKPADYDKRFNFKFQGQKDGLVYFRRFDEKTGKDLLKGQKNVSLELIGSISPAMTNGVTTTFFWDVAKDDPQSLYKGQAAAKLETDRLFKRLDKLRKDKAEEQAKLDAINGEITTIQQRVDELAKQQ